MSQLEYLEFKIPVCFLVNCAPPLSWPCDPTTFTRNPLRLFRKSPRLPTLRLPSKRRRWRHGEEPVLLQPWHLHRAPALAMARPQLTYDIYVHSRSIKLISMIGTWPGMKHYTMHQRLVSVPGFVCVLPPCMLVSCVS